MHRPAILALSLLAAAPHLSAQTSPAALAWTGGASLLQYLIPDEPDFMIVRGTASHGAMRVEGRWNWEELNTGSLFAGRTFAGGDRLELEFTPSLGLVAGELDGVAAAAEFSAVLGPVDFYLEGEYVVDVQTSENDFLYSWSELGVTPIAPLRLGLAAQRLRVYQTPLELERGAFLGFTSGRFTLAGYVFNPATDFQYVVVSLDLEF